MSDASDWRASPAKRLQARIISALGYPLAALLTSTLRWRSEGEKHYDAVIRSGPQPIMALWQRRILPATYYLRRRNIDRITSETINGECIAGNIKPYGYGT